MPGGGGGGQSQGTSTQVAKSEPWAGQQPFLTRGFNEASRIYDSGAPQVFPGQTLAAQDPAQSTALNWGENRALAGNPLLPAAQAQAFSTINGDFLGAGNPYFSAMADRVGNEVTKGVNSTFGGAGRWASGAHANALSSGLSDAIGQLAYQNYGQERQNQLAAVNAAPGLAEADYNDISRLGQIGDARRGFGQEQIADDVSRFNQQQNQPWQALANYMQMIQGNYGGSNTSTTTSTLPRSSAGAGLLGGAATGGALGGALAGMSDGAIGGPLGLGVGAGLGGLLGLFGR